jgi:hypothetical protein
MPTPVRVDTSMSAKAAGFLYAALDSIAVVSVIGERDSPS